MRRLPGPWRSPRGPCRSCHPGAGCIIRRSVLNSPVFFQYLVGQRSSLVVVYIHVRERRSLLYVHPLMVLGSTMLIPILRSFQTLPSAGFPNGMEDFYQLGLPGLLEGWFHSGMLYIQSCKKRGICQISTCPFKFGRNENRGRALIFPTHISPPVVTWYRFQAKLVN